MRDRGMPDDDRGTVLIVEDDQPLAAYYDEILSAFYDTRTAYDGYQGLVLYDDEVDVILLDRDLPEMSGIEVLERIRAVDTECRVAMLTGMDPDFDIISMPIDDYLTKPVTGDDLVDAVDTLLQLHAYDEELRELYQLCTIQASLRRSKSPDELAESDEYAHLIEEIDRQRKQLDETFDRLPDQSFDAVFPPE